MGFGRGGNTDLEISDPLEPGNQINGVGIALGMGSVAIGGGRRIAPERDDVAHARLPVAARDLVDLGAARADAGQVRRRHQRGFAQDPGDGGVGALARRAAGAVSDRYETRAERFEPLDGRPQNLLHLLGLGGKELEGDLGPRQGFRSPGGCPVRGPMA